MFEELVRQWVDAEADGDVERLAGLLDPEFRGDGSAGRVLGRSEWIDRPHWVGLGAGGLRWQPIDVRVNSQIAVATGQLSPSSDRTEADGTTYICTLVAVQRDTGWTIVNVQLRTADSAT